MTSSMGQSAKLLFAPLSMRPFVGVASLAVGSSSSAAAVVKLVDGVRVTSLTDDAGAVNFSRVDAPTARAGDKDSKAQFQQGMKKWIVDKGFIPIANVVSIQLTAETTEEIDYNVYVLSSHGVIYRFRGFWPSLPQLHSWIFEQWEPFITDERNALLAFKEGLDFTSSHYTLQSWKGFNCCAWEGVSCHPITGHIISLDLSPHSLNASWNPHDVIMPSPFMSWRELRGELFQLRHLESLNLSENAFIPSLAIPSQFYKLSNLRYLSLSNSNLFARIPREIELHRSIYCGKNLVLDIYVQAELSHLKIKTAGREKCEKNSRVNIVWLRKQSLRGKQKIHGIFRIDLSELTAENTVDRNIVQNERKDE
ncbi:hypothetical protein SUGI_0201390 [Cryptomeria japonica]|nr:hypothetical protein SUGI_0201390 [Cryptomeria japonica]